MALATAAAAAAISFHPFFSRPTCVLRCGRRFPPLLLRASSTSTSISSAPSDFNITFAEPSPPKTSSPSPSAQPLVPWIARGEDGKPFLRTSPPPDVLQAIALAEAEAKKSKKDPHKSQKGALAAPVANVKAKEKKAAPAAPPKFSKAARRFYNEHIRERKLQRLAKVLAAAVASRRTSEELIFQGKAGYVVTTDGAVHKKHLLAISEGTKIDGVKCIPDLVEPLVAQPDTKKTRLRIVVHEGRNHEVRELVQNAGLKVYALKHVRIGRFRLPSDLGIGKFVELKQVDIKSLEGNN